ncbi:ROK family protein [Sphingobacterium sp. SGG-5]|uniref:ROK family protein n=1 Tax=Sphingobacterium sp. SGG-5 TaxID=2710881 RepID=UPI0013EC1C42|nr:ROK family protein [Sphingobacterium sp. SGG-5]NGM61088.1 ROK family protein [Sphingobacterium sp. SGG-5]
MDTANYSIGIDLGGTRIKVGLVIDNVVTAKTIIPAQSVKGLQRHLPAIQEAIDNLIVRTGLPISGLDGVGLAFPGIVDSRSQRIISTNQKYDDALHLDLAGWVKRNWVVPFFIDNDARMAAVGEWRYGAGKDTDNLVVMTIGTGIGTAAIIAGQLLRGKHFQAGCLGGHFSVRYNGRECTCGNLGCVEAYASAWSLKNTSEMAFTDFKALFETANSGNPFAIQVRQECLDIWSAGIINLIHAYDPEVVVLGGGVLNSSSDIVPYITEKVRQHAWCPWGDVQIRPTQLLSDAGILGAVYGLHHPI